MNSTNTDHVNDAATHEGLDGNDQDVLHIEDHSERAIASDINVRANLIREEAELPSFAEQSLANDSIALQRSLDDIQRLGENQNAYAHPEQRLKLVRNLRALIALRARLHDSLNGARSADIGRANGISRDEELRLQTQMERVQTSHITVAPTFMESPMTPDGFIHLTFDTDGYRRELLASKGRNDWLRDLGEDSSIDANIRQREKLASVIRSLIEKHPQNERLLSMYNNNQEVLSALRLSRQHASYLRAGGEVRWINSEREQSAVAPMGDDWINPLREQFPVIAMDIGYTPKMRAQYANKGGYKAFFRDMNRHLYTTRGYTVEDSRVFADPNDANKVTGYRKEAAKHGQWSFPQVDRTLQGRYNWRFRRPAVSIETAALPVGDLDDERLVATNTVSNWISKFFVRPPTDGLNPDTMTDEELRKNGFLSMIELSAVGPLMERDAQGNITTPSGKIYAQYAGKRTGDVETSSAGAVQVRRPSSVPIIERDDQGAMLYEETTGQDRRPKAVGTVQQPFFGPDFDFRAIASVGELPFSDRKGRRAALDLQSDISALFNAYERLKEKPGGYEEAYRTMQRRVRVAMKKTVDSIFEHAAAERRPKIPNDASIETITSVLAATDMSEAQRHQADAVVHAFGILGDELRNDLAPEAIAKRFSWLQEEQKNPA